MLLEDIGKIISAVDNFVWPIFIPFLLVLALYTTYKIFVKVRPGAGDADSIKFKNIIGPSSIALGTMVGTGAIIGVLGSLTTLAVGGQVHFEAIAFWGVVGALFLVPLNYTETLVTKLYNDTPKAYISKLLTPSLGKTYAIAFLLLNLIGFAGFQFSGIDTAVGVLAEKISNSGVTEIERFVFISVPVIIITILIASSKKQKVFIESLTYLIFSAVFLYFIFFITFIFKTNDYIPIFFDNLLEGVKNPVNVAIGIPIGVIVGLQRIIQTSETGLGATGMTSLQANSKPREAALISLMPTVVTIFVAIVVTTYITSYGVYSGIVKLTDESGNAISQYEILKSYFATAGAVTGDFGYLTLIIFMLFSGLTSLIGNYYFLDILYDASRVKKLIIFGAATTVAGAGAVFGFTLVFELTDVLIFICTALNVVALSVFVTKKYKDYIYLDGKPSMIKKHKTKA